ncbi:MAG: hypothetical protein J7L15_06365 [Clostridiales bacterium]|nr:hypothetical protein [Clostridiales bacterium]
MEIFIGLISFFMIIGGGLEVFNLSKDNKYKIIAAITSVSGALLFITVWFIGNALTEEKITVHTNVLEYERIVYSIPKTITERKTMYPWWSTREDIEYKATIN